MNLGGVHRRPKHDLQPGVTNASSDSVVQRKFTLCRCATPKGTEGTELMDTGLPCILFTHTGTRTGAIRKTPLMRVKDGDNYVLVASKGGAPDNPVWVYNLRADPRIGG